ncbi:hypothetical protein B0H16DRAFT_1722107 [Mycena metata]|uniref:Uncharacterized protein n=1 Tax=Mycena metata TaxID=1033252 RepID=A0AAD7J787_9AGAR|nr:hypothetical protein B0H16DRAFT_1722107 [Mycena metata]
MKDLKDRYCSVCRKFLRNRPWTGDESKAASFAAREVVRKRYVTILENRTPEQIAEEEALYMEIKRLELERDSSAPSPASNLDRQTLWKTSCGSRASPATPSPATPSAPKRRVAVRATSTAYRGAALTLPPPTQELAYDVQHCITRTDAGAAASEGRVPARVPLLPQDALTQELAPKVTQVLVVLGVSLTRLVMPTQGNLVLLKGPVDATAVLMERKAVEKNRLGMKSTARPTTAERRTAGATRWGWKWMGGTKRTGECKPW